MSHVVADLSLCASLSAAPTNLQKVCDSHQCFLISMICCKIEHFHRKKYKNQFLQSLFFENYEMLLALQFFIATYFHKLFKPSLSLFNYPFLPLSHSFLPLSSQPYLFKYLSIGPSGLYMLFKQIMRPTV